MSNKIRILKKIEAILFVSARPLSEQKITSLLNVDKKEIKVSLERLQKKYLEDDSGIKLIKSGLSWQMVTAPDMAAIVKDYLKEEVKGELTRPSLEALTIIAYRGPITKAELEQIRGVNCSLILRNLLIRGLIEEEINKKNIMPCYQVTVDFIKYLGLSRVSDLPDYEKLNKHVTLDKFLKQQVAE